MALGGTAKKIQKLADTAEKLYEQIKDLQQRMVNVEESVDESTERLDHLVVESEKQRVLLEAIAAEHDIDVEQVLAEAAIEEAEPLDAEDAVSEHEGSDDAVNEDEGSEDAVNEDGGSTDADTEDGGSDPTRTADGSTTEAPTDGDAPTVVDEQGNTVE